MQKHKHQLLLPQTEKYNNNNNNISAYQPDKQLLQQKQSKTKTPKVNICPSGERK